MVAYLANMVGVGAKTSDETTLGADVRSKLDLLAAHFYLQMCNILKLSGGLGRYS